MALNDRLSRLRLRLSGPASKRRPAASEDSRGPRTAAGDARRASAAVSGVATELLKVGREMLVIPAQLWMAAAEVAGAATLFAWRRGLRPLLLALAALVRAAYRLALRHVTPARAVVAVCVVAIAALVASQWLDYRGISVGTGDYTGDVEAVAQAPEVDRATAGDAHAWIMLPIALGAFVVLVVAATGQARTARWLIALGLAAIVIAVAIDAPKGLDEGPAAIAYEGAQARLLEGFWVQIAAGAVLVVCGLLLPRYLSAVPAAEPAGGARGPGLLAGMRAASKRRRARAERARGRDRRRVEGAGT
jgi:hypothetical protein